MVNSQPLAVALPPAESGRSTPRGQKRLLQRILGVRVVAGQHSQVAEERILMPAHETVIGGAQVAPGASPEEIRIRFAQCCAAGQVLKPNRV